MLFETRDSPPVQAFTLRRWSWELGGGGLFNPHPPITPISPNTLQHVEYPQSGHWKPPGGGFPPGGCSIRRADPMAFLPPGLSVGDVPPPRRGSVAIHTPTGSHAPPPSAVSGVRGPGSGVGGRGPGSGHPLAATPGGGPTGPAAAAAMARRQPPGSFARLRSEIPDCSGHFRGCPPQSQKVF